MTLRRVLSGDGRLVHQLVDDLLDRDDDLIVLVDGDRTASYSVGFGASPCQLELLTVEIERVVRDVIGGQLIKTGNSRTNRENSGRGDARDVGTPLRQHLDRSGSGRHRGVTDRGTESPATALPCNFARQSKYTTSSMDW